MSTKLMKIIISIPVNEISSINKMIKSFHHGDLEISAVQNNRGEIDFNHINWQGIDILPLLKNLTQAEDILQMCTDACLNYIDSLEPFDKWQLQQYGNILDRSKLVFQSREDAFATWMNKEAELELEKLSHA